VAGTVLAHGGATGVVQERMEAMERIDAAMKRIAAMFRGETDYDAGTVKQAAQTISRHGGAQLTRLFPAGSIQAPSEALPAIWRNWPRFQALADDLVAYGDALAAAADNGPYGPGQGQGMGQGMGYGTMQGRGMMQGQGQRMGQGMMGGGRMAGRGPQGHPLNDADALKQMPAHAAFMRLTQTCNACHTAFRKEEPPS
jgi:cytochrome c556